MRANEQTDERVAQYLRLDSCLFQTTVHRCHRRCHHHRYHHTSTTTATATPATAAKSGRSSTPAYGNLRGVAMTDQGSRVAKGVVDGALAALLGDGRAALLGEGLALNSGAFGGGGVIRGLVGG